MVQKEVGQLHSALSLTAQRSRSFFPLEQKLSELQSIYDCSIMEDLATCETPGLQHMNANNKRRGETALCVCHTAPPDGTQHHLLNFTFLFHLCLNLLRTSPMRKRLNERTVRWFQQHNQASLPTPPRRQDTTAWHHHIVTSSLLCVPVSAAQ